MRGHLKSVNFPIAGERIFDINLDKGLKRSEVINGGGFSDCENISYNKYPVLSPADMRQSAHSQISYYNLTAPSTMFENDGGSSMFSFGDYILLVRWGMCAQNVENGYQYTKMGKAVTRDFKKGYHYVICDCLKPVKNSLVLICSSVLFDEYEENIYNTDFEIYANPSTYLETDIHPQEMSDSDKEVIYLYNGKYYYYDESWFEMKLNKNYLYDRKVFYYDSYLECWLMKRAYTDIPRDAGVFSQWSSDDPSLMFGKYKKYIVIMPDAVMIELDENGFPKEDKFFEGQWLNTCICRSENNQVYGMKLHKLEACTRDSEGVIHYYPYPDVSAIMSGATRMFAVGSGRIYATKPNTANDFTYDSALSNSPSNAWAVSVLNEGVSDSKLCALCNYGEEIIAFSNENAYKIYGKTSPFRIGTLMDCGTFGQKSICECAGKLYFANPRGIYCYNGATVSCISASIDTGKLNNAILTALDDVLYIYLDCDTDKAIYTYNTTERAFLKLSLPYDSFIESEERQMKDIKDMTALNDSVYILTYASYDTRPAGSSANYDTSKAQIYRLTTGSSEYLSYRQKWFFETNPISGFIPDMERVTAVEMVVRGDGKGIISVYLLSDDEYPDETNLLFRYTCSKKLSVIRYSVRKTEALTHRLHIKGEGNADIHSIRLKLVSGGDKFESDR